MAVKQTAARTWLLLLTFLPVAAVSAQPTPPEQPDESWRNLQEVVGLIHRAYVDPVDIRSLLPAALGGLTDALDPFSTFVPSHEIDAFAQVRNVSSSRSGLLLLKDRGIVFVAAVVPASPATRAGLRPGDIVKAINGLATRSLPRWKVQRFLAGSPGERLNLQILRAAEESSAVLELTDFAWPALVERDVEGVPVLTLTRIDSGTLPQLAARLEELARRAVGALVLDLRNCAWGSPETAFEVASLFSTGHLGELLKRSESIQTFRGADRPLWTGRLFILTARSTLGPGDVLAAVLGGTGRAELIGERTFGHAGRKKELRFSSGDTLWLTDAFYAGPDGLVIREGIEPDLEVGSDPSGFSASEDPVLERALQRAKGGS